MDYQEILSYRRNIKPLFRSTDRAEMLYMFDLWQYLDVVKYLDDIWSRIADETMPCDEPWNQSQILLFRQWIDQGAEP